MQHFLIYMDIHMVHQSTQLVHKLIHLMKNLRFCYLTDIILNNFIIQNNILKY